MDSNLLLCFHAVAVAGHVTAAAATLGITQPAVSKQVKQLERSLGTRLIERAGRGIVLTAAGRELAVYAARLAAVLTDADAAMADLTSLRRGRLRVGASPTIGLYLLPPLLVRYRLKYPGIDLAVEIEQSAALYRRLADQQLDLALCEVEPTIDRFAARVFMYDTYRAIVPRKHPLAKAKSVSLQQLNAAGLIVRQAESPGASFVEQVIRQAGAVARPIMRLDGTESIKQAVAAGLGVGIVSGLALSAEDRRLRAAPLRGVSMRRPLYAVRPRAGAEGKPLIAFAYLLKHAARGSLPPLARPITPAR